MSYLFYIYLFKAATTVNNKIIETLVQINLLRLNSSHLETAPSALNLNELLSAILHEECYFRKYTHRNAIAFTYWSLFFQIAKFVQAELGQLAPRQTVVEGLCGMVKGQAFPEVGSRIVLVVVDRLRNIYGLQSLTHFSYKHSVNILVVPLTPLLLLLQFYSHFNRLQFWINKV